MSSLADDRDQDNDDLREIDVPATSAAVDPARPPPIATEFNRVTTRFMIAAREWARANPERALEALKRAVVTWSGVFWLTYWRYRGHHPLTGTAERRGHGEETLFTIPQYAAWLDRWGHGTYPKSRAVATTMARSRYLGHSDDECVLRSGIFMDGDGCGGWNEARALYRHVGLAFVGQMRPVAPDRHHIELPLARELVPVRGESGVADWKASVYCPTLGWALGVLSELVGLRYQAAWDRAGRPSAKHAGYDTACDQLTHLNFVYTRRPTDPVDHVAVTEHACGGALDLDTLLALTDFGQARAQLPLPTRHVARVAGTRAATASSAERAQRKQSVGIEIDPKMELLVRLRTLARPESQEIIDHCLTGRSYAARGERDHTMWRIASIVAALAPDEDPVELAKLVFTKSLKAMAKLPDSEPRVDYVAVKLALAAEKIARAQRKLGGGR
jgi:hypothetical protein